MLCLSGFELYSRWVPLTHCLREMLRLILKQNFCHFNGKHHLQNHGTAMGIETGVSIPLPTATTTTLSKTVFKPTVWKCYYIDDIFSLWDISKLDIEAFIELENLRHPTIKFTAETSGTETTCILTRLYTKAMDSRKNLSFMQTHFKHTETFLRAHFSSCRPLSVKKGFVKGEALRILRKNSSERPLRKIIQIQKQRSMDRGYPQTLI